MVSNMVLCGLAPSGGRKPAWRYGTMRWQSHLRSHLFGVVWQVVRLLRPLLLGPGAQPLPHLLLAIRYGRHDIIPNACCPAFGTIGKEQSPARYIPAAKLVTLYQFLT